jgi:hypothetical protein
MGMSTKPSVLSILYRILQALRVVRRVNRRRVLRQPCGALQLYPHCDDVQRVGSRWMREHLFRQVAPSTAFHVVHAYLHVLHVGLVDSGA